MAMRRREDRTFVAVLMPRHRKTVDTFRDQMWLTEPRTRQFISDLLELVDLWDRIPRTTMLDKITRAIVHIEENLKPFYSTWKNHMTDLGSYSRVSQRSYPDSKPLNANYGKSRVILRANARYMASMKSIWTDG
jgi:hypothetical protein